MYACQTDVPRAGNCTSIRGIGNPTILIFFFTVLFGVLLLPAGGVLLSGARTCSGQVPLLGEGLAL